MISVEEQRQHFDEAIKTIETAESCYLSCRDTIAILEEKSRDLLRIENDHIISHIDDRPFWFYLSSYFTKSAYMSSKEIYIYKCDSLKEMIDSFNKSYDDYKPSYTRERYLAIHLQDQVFFDNIDDAKSYSMAVTVIHKFTDMSGHFDKVFNKSKEVNKFSENCKSYKINEHNFRKGH